MGQYYIAVNTTKREYVCPYCIGGVAKLFEWAANPWAGIFPLLLARTDGAGGGDPDWDDPAVKEIVGRWAGDSVVLIGDYDSSDLYGEARSQFVNISLKVLEVMRRFVGYESTDGGLCLSCQEAATKPVAGKGE